VAGSLEKNMLPFPLFSTTRFRNKDFDRYFSIAVKSSFILHIPQQLAEHGALVLL
jgi:hypothetical protein